MEGPQLSSVSSVPAGEVRRSCISRRTGLGVGGRRRGQHLDCVSTGPCSAGSQGRGSGSFEEIPCSETGSKPRRDSPETLGDRKSTRLNSSHGYISYAVFC